MALAVNIRLGGLLSVSELLSYSACFRIHAISDSGSTGGMSYNQVHENGNICRPFGYCALWCMQFMTTKCHSAEIWSTPHARYLMEDRKSANRKIPSNEAGLKCASGESNNGR
jgi:hypothetical protein